MRKQFLGILSLAAILGVAACGPKGDFEKAINAGIGEPMCLAFANMDKIKFPIHVEKSPKSMAVYEALQKDGDITVQEIFSQSFVPLLEVDLTDKGKAAGVWGKGGFCYGHKQVVAIVRYQEQDAGANVEYRYQITDAPSWAKAGLDIDGMKEPADGTAILSKYSDGWKFVTGT
ncbi:hypothetical protein [Nitrospirillum viridazoti]|uniref:WD-40 repeat-containing protein n=1 Tax=Nitrospirillum amazonense TaxID=28077 RepID=A0A560J0X8_9PROT|nr:hypothetical protein [Nitrospirillum amazonense]TWB64425.1 WD-40 repeat-containing protein [Nitrospirillum amazonense]